MPIYRKLLLLLVVFSVRTSANQLDSEYSKEFTDLIELIYGSNFLSQGGTESVDRMFAGHDLNNKKILDIGSGLGGTDFYLAEKYDVDITGIDAVARLVDDANQRKNQYKLLGSVIFIHQDANNFSYPYPDNSFDIVFSKESFLHITDKESLIKEIFRILKPGGQLIILDWLIESHDLGPTITEMMRIDGLDFKMATPQEYSLFMHNTGFHNLSLSCMNKLYIEYTQNNIDTIKAHKANLIQLFGQEEYGYSLKTWDMQKNVFEKSEVLITLLKATKPH